MGVSTDRWLRPLGWASLVANVVLVCTGGAVRLTGSGLGCPTWPRCNGSSFTPRHALNVHSAIEFGNRTLTFVLVVIAIGTVLATVRSSRRDLRGPSILLALAIPLQAVIGGISVLTDLNPWVVSFHLLCSMAIIGIAVLFLWRLGQPVPGTSGERRRDPPGAVAGLAWATFASAWAVLYVGTVVTGSGPHAGDASAPRNGLDPLQLSQLHTDVVFLLVGLTLGLLFALHTVGAPARTVQVVRLLVAVELLQGAIGFVQYFSDLPIVLVGFHMLGAATISAVVTWTLLECRVTQASGGE